MGSLPNILKNTHKNKPDPNPEQIYPNQSQPRIPLSTLKKLFPLRVGRAPRDKADKSSLKSEKCGVGIIGHVTLRDESSKRDYIYFFTISVIISFFGWVTDYCVSGMTRVKCVRRTHVSEQRTRSACVKHVWCSNCNIRTRLLEIF